MTISKHLSCILCLIFSTNVSAMLIDTGTTTIDTDTGFEWLDLTTTVGLSYNDIDSELGLGGAFEGWRYATGTEIEGLFESAGGTGPYDGWSSLNNGVVDALSIYWGTTEPDEQTSWFITGDTDLNGQYYFGVIGDSPNREGTETVDFMSTYFDLVSVDTRNDMTGSALVRTTIVPLPPALWLFASGMVGLISISRATRIKA